MKFILSAVSLLTLISVHAMAQEIAMPGARVSYSCTTGNPFTNGVSTKNAFYVYSDDSVTGVFAGKEFKYSSKPEKEKDGVYAWHGPSDKIVVRLQVPGPYDGMQDTIWGQMVAGGVSKNLNCYTSGN